MLQVLWPSGFVGLEVKSNGASLGTNFTAIDFIGAGVAVVANGSTAEVTIPGGGGGGVTVQDTFGNVLPGVSLLSLQGPGQVAAGAPGEALWTPITGAPDALVYCTGTGGTTTTDAALVAAPLDPYLRPQLRDTRVNLLAPQPGAVWRQGAWSVDGDASDIPGDGIVIYGPANGLQDPLNGMFGRVKADRFALRRIVAGVDIGYSFRVDPTELYLKNDASVQTFNVQRASGDVTTSGSLVVGSTIEVYGGGPGTEVAYPVPTVAQDRMAAYANQPELAYAPGLRFKAGGLPRFYELSKGFAFDNSVGYAVVTFDPPVAPAGAPYFGAGNGMLFKAQDALLGSGLAGGDVGIQAGASTVGSPGGTAFVQPGANPLSPGERGVAEMRDVFGAAVVATGGANNGLGFFGTVPSGQLTVVGSRGGNAALASLLTQLAIYGLIIDGSTP